jgi:hypothetical protein
MRRYSSRTLHRYNEAITLLMTEPRTVKGLQQAMGIKGNNQTDRYIRAFRDFGLIYIKGYTPTRAAIWAWQPKPFEMSDAKMAEGTYLRRKPRPAKAAPLGVSSVFALGDAMRGQA